MQAMETAFVAGTPGDGPVEKLVFAAQRLGARFDGYRWKGLTPKVLRPLRRYAEILGINPPEPLDDPLVPIEYEEWVIKREIARIAAARDRVETRFRKVVHDGGAQAVFNGQAPVVARLVEGDLPVTPESLAWLATIGPDVDPLPADAHIPVQVVKAAEAEMRGRVDRAIRGRSKRSALAGEQLDLTRPFAGVIINETAVQEAVGDVTPVVNQRAEVKRQLTALWRLHWLGEFPARCSDERWRKVAWLTFVGYALPPVFPDQRWKARKDLSDALVDSRLTITELSATLETARKAAIGAAMDQFIRALR